jgi:hypothetical protein
VDCHEYRTADATSGEQNSASPQEAWDTLLRELRKRGLTKGHDDHFDPTGDAINRTSLYLGYRGKAPPEDVILVLRLAHAVGLVPGTRAGLTDYCTRYLGVDCSGFVTNYLRHHGRTELGHGGTRSTYYRQAGHQRRAVESVFARDVMAFTQTNHVALIDRVEPFIASADGLAQVTCWVAESAGARLRAGDAHTDGLLCTRYTLTGPLNHTNFWFRARRAGPEWAGSSTPNAAFSVVVRRLL